MKKLWLTLILILLASPCFSANLAITGGGVAAACTTPSGTTLTESFGEGSTLCWSGGTSVCNSLWAKTGTGISIAASPGAPAANTDCANSLAIVNPAASTNYVVLPLPVTIPSGTAYTFEMGFYVTSHAIDAWNVEYMMALGSTVGTGDIAAGVLWFTTGPTDLEVEPWNNTERQVLSIGAWHTLVISVNGASSYLAIDGGTHRVFTAGAKDTNYIILGQQTSGYAISWSIGYLKIDCASVNWTSPQMLVDFENGTNGDTITTGILAAGTHGGNGAWSIAGTASLLTVATASEFALHTSVTISGTTYTDAGATRGLKYLHTTGTASAYISYAFLTNSPTVSAGFFFHNGNVALADTNRYTIGGFAGLGSDYAEAQLNTGGVYLETAGGNGATVTLPSAGALYYVTIQYVRNGTSAMNIYETSTWTLIGSSTHATGDYAATHFDLGKTGSETGTNGAYYLFDDLKIDYVSGNFPLL
jgi:hypothetical protein